MDSTVIALIISILSALIAMFSLGWNIYRDVILKARVRINFNIVTIMREGANNNSKYVSLSAVNHGPGIINLSTIRIKDSSIIKKITKKTQHAIVIPDYNNPLSGKLPKKLEVGETIDFLFPYEEDCLLKKCWHYIGLNDSFGRTHWAKKSNVQKAIKEWQNDFGNNT